jgi:hypothetical protein
MIRRIVRRFFHVAFVAACLYLLVAWAAFQWQNPTANQMSIYRDFASVIFWEKLDKYQR